MINGETATTTVIADDGNVTITGGNAIAIVTTAIMATVAARFTTAIPETIPADTVIPVAAMAIPAVDTDTLVQSMAGLVVAETRAITLVFRTADTWRNATCRRTNHSIRIRETNLVIGRTDTTVRSATRTIIGRSIPADMLPAISRVTAVGEAGGIEAVYSF
jgi:hypothetical protein